MRAVMPGEGPNQCAHLSNGRQCGNHEIDGLEFCLRHVPDEVLEEAEEACGYKRCRHDFGSLYPCHAVAVKGTDPPRCKTHGANLGSASRKNAERRVIEGKVQDRMVAIMGEQGDRLLHPPPIGNPLTELLDLAAEIAEWKNIMRDIVVYLVSRERLRSAHDKVGEQLRAEVLLFERAQERYAKILQDIAKLGIEARLAQVEETQVAVIERALTSALTASGLDLLAQEHSRKVLRRELARAARAG